MHNEEQCLPAQRFETKVYMQFLSPQTVMSACTINAVLDKIFLNDMLRTVSTEMHGREMGQGKRGLKFPFNLKHGVQSPLNLIRKCVCVCVCTVHHSMPCAIEEGGSKILSVLYKGQKSKLSCHLQTCTH